MNSFSEKIKSLLNSDKRIRWLLIACAAAVLLIIISDSSFFGTESKNDKVNNYDYNEYINSLETDTQELISSIRGVGRCKVMITLKNSNESIYAKNIEENKSDSSESYKNEYIFYNGNNGESPVLIKEYFPEIQGVAVVCDGADNAAVYESVVKSISSLFNISANKISVSKYKG